MAGGKTIAPAVSRLLAIAVGALFIYAGILKALDPAQFAGDIANFRLLPQLAGAVLAVYLPWLEIVCGMALVFKKTYRGALLILTALCLIFLAALASTMARGLDISCGCFGHAHPHPLWGSLLLDVFLLAALCFVLAAEIRSDR